MQCKADEFFKAYGFVTRVRSDSVRRTRKLLLLLLLLLLQARQRPGGGESAGCKLEYYSSLPGKQAY
jgi:hypothetical protein